LVESSRSGDSGMSVPPGDILASTSLESLRAEIVRLRSKCAEMEIALQDLRRVTEQIDQVMGEVSNIRERINFQTSHALHEEDEAEAQEEADSRQGIPSQFTE